MFRLQRIIAKVLWILVIFVLYFAATKTDTVFQEMSGFALATALGVLSCAVLLDAMVAHLQKVHKHRGK